MRPHEIRGASGVIPKVKINYIEIASMATMNKENVKDVCEIIYKFLATKSNKDGQLQIDLPGVGRFIIRNGICAISFTNELIEQTRGATARAFNGGLFSSANATLNLKLDH